MQVETARPSHNRLLPPPLAAQMLLTEGFKIYRLPAELSFPTRVLFDQAREFFDDGVANDEVRSLDHLNKVLEFCSGDKENRFDEFEQVSPTQQAVHLQSGGYLSERYFQVSEAITRFESAIESMYLTAGWIQHSAISIYNTTPASDDDDQEVSAPAQVDAGILSLLYAESEGLEVEHYTSGQWQIVKCPRGSMVVMAGQEYFSAMQSAAAEDTSLPRDFPACRYRTRAGLALRIGLRPGSGDIFKQQLPIGRNFRWRAGTDSLIMERTTLKEEVLAQHQRWLAMMMALHVRLGTQSILARFGGMPAEVWTMICGEALSRRVELEVHVQDGSGRPAQRITARGALEEVPLIALLDPAFARAQLATSDFKFTLCVRSRYQTRSSTAESRTTLLKRFRTLAEQRAVLLDTAVITARPWQDDEERSITFKVRREGAADVFFKAKRFTPLYRTLQVYCEREQLDRHKIALAFNGRKVWPWEESPECHGMQDGEELEALAG